MSRFLYIVLSLLFFNFLRAQVVVPIDNYSVNSYGQVQLSIQAQADKYYMLSAQHAPGYQWDCSMTMGTNGTMVISEPAGAYPQSAYTITEYPIANPADSDGDGIDDVTEFNNMPTDAPINFAAPVAFVDGATSIPDAQTFQDLATVNNVPWAPFLDDQLYVKFGILDRDSNEPKVYFINSNTYTIHATFFNSIGATVNGDDGSGEIVFNPNDIMPNGAIGSYSFNFSFGDAKDFAATQRTFELLVANMPFLQNNMTHFIGESDEDDHLNNYAADFVGSRIPVVLESDVFAEVNYIPFHEAEGYGFFRHMELDEDPGSRDIVIYDALPNSLPRVGGIITSVVQTPLSHVNLRAIQDDVPNAYIKDPLLIDSIANLLGSYIYYKVEADKFTIREATLAEVNEWYEDIRPTEPQTPIRDLSITEIMDLDSIGFEMSTSFGAKCSNVATMRTFDLPSGTIPDGFGIPFYYYDEFMKFNNFYQEAEVMINNPAFINDINFRVDRLKTFRKSIKDAPMPQWMMDDLQAMHDAFPVGTKVRCRSSTNNEDLPGFSGAGLYTSKTQHLDEGHISKSIKQVYASMWNFRAYEERDFFRVDHFAAAMGVLCHPNFEEEQSNGVGISIDPIYETDSTFYLNTQVGESLITNPDPNSIPEEILLYEDPNQGAGYLVLRLSNLTNPGELVMDQVYLDQMREDLTTIHDEFAILYDVPGVEGFAMDIEYKVTAQDQLAIKQARPWVSFWANVKANNDLSVQEIISPQSSASLGNSELVTVKVANTGLNEMDDFDLSLLVDGQVVETMNISSAIQPFEDADFQFTIGQDFSAIGDYDVMVVLSDADDEYDKNDTLQHVLRKLHMLDGGIAIGDVDVVCDNDVTVDAVITNYGETTITDVEIQVVVNGTVVGVITESVNIPYEETGTVTVTINSNLQPTNNNIVLNLLNANNQTDGDAPNNAASTVTDLDSDFDIITFVINADNYPQETSWKILDGTTNELISQGSLSNGASGYTEDICVDYTSCYALYFYDSFGDGICCGYGMGNFSVLDASGNTLVYNNGDFDHEAIEVFCPDGSGCNFTADVSIAHATSGVTDDGSITIYTNSGFSPFQYSIDGGQSFSSLNTFENLAPGTYDVHIQGAAGICIYHETVTIDACTFLSADIEAETVTSVITTNGSIEIIPTSGVAPYMYSIDGGQNFVSSNFFPNLPVGNYNVVVEDASGVCVYQETVPVEVCQITAIVETSNTSSALIADGTITFIPTSGTGPYQYSIDGGQNFVAGNEFFGLSAGDYEVVMMDAAGKCNYEDTITIEFSVPNSLQDLSNSGIKVYPNPTSDLFTVALESSVSLQDDVVIEVYDFLGRKIKTSVIAASNKERSAIISLEGYSSGSYFIRTKNDAFDSVMKLVKM